MVQGVQAFPWNFWQQGDPENPGEGFSQGFSAENPWEVLGAGMCLVGMGVAGNWDGLHSNPTFWRRMSQREEQRKFPNHGMFFIQPLLP